MSKKSFFERLTGTVKLDESEFDEPAPKMKLKEREVEEESPSPFEPEEKVGQLTVDVYQTNDHIIVKTMVAGVRPEDLDITITRDMVTIRGKREEERAIQDDNYFIRELYWGSFARTITLPEEVDVEESDAIEKHGLLILKLPKMDKKRQTKLKVKTI
jgi:HSP20 family protein